MRTRPHIVRRHDGFTLIELMIVLVLTAIMLAAAFPVITNLLRSSGRAVASNSARGEASTVGQQIAADIRAILSPRSTGERVDTQNTIQTLALNQDDAHDITFAGPRLLEIWADVIGSDGISPDPSPGVERVRWYLLITHPRCGALTPDEPTNWCVVREVGWGARPPGGVHAQMTREVIARGSGNYPVDRECFPEAAASVTYQTQRLFCYRWSAPRNGATTGTTTQYTWTGWRATCETMWLAGPTTGANGTAAARFTHPSGTAWSATDGTGFSGVRRSSPGTSITAWHTRVDYPGDSSDVAPINSLDRITTIGVVTPGGGMMSGSRRNRVSVTEVDIPGRSSTEYRTAILCGAR